MRLIPDEVKRQILRLWMDGMTLRQISLEKNVSTGEISNIINAYRQATPNLDELRKLYLVLGEAKTRLPDALRGAELLSYPGNG